MGRLEEAEIQYKLALKADLNDREVHNNYGLLLEKMGRFGEAQKHFKIAL
jgi:Tfp pilus assembly protein PilF